MAYEPTPFDSYVTAGLDKAQGLMGAGYPASQYPSYIPSQTRAPSQADYVSYTPNSPLQQIQQPDYKVGLMGGDWNAYQQALTQPGQQAAQTAYGQGLTNLQNTMGGQGLYGSSIMGNQMNQGLNQGLMNTLATNASQAAAQRYQQQQAATDAQNNWNANMYSTNINQASNIYGAGLNDANRQQAYGQNALNWQQQQAENMRGWQNAQDYEKFTYQQSANAFQNQMQENQMNQALALAGRGAPLSQMATNYSIAQQQAAAARDAANAQAQAATYGGLMSGIGTLSGGLLGGSNTANNLNSLGSTVSNWFS
jgi:hypothetical protein